jgi:hypothetical protein
MSLLSRLDSYKVDDTGAGANQKLPNYGYNNDDDLFYNGFIFLNASDPNQPIIRRKIHFLCIAP